MATEFHKTSSV